MSDLAYTRAGSGAPLVLLHGLGSFRGAWAPVQARLAEHFDVIAVDLPGFGDSAPLPQDIEPHPAALAAVIAAELAELGIRNPHLAGNSLGGWIALELAAIEPVASLTLLSPAGLWRDSAPQYCRISLRATRLLARSLTRPLHRVVGTRVGRAAVFAQVVARPADLDADAARAAITAMASCPAFGSTLANAAVTAPVTVAFGDRDRILLARQARSLAELPDHTVTRELACAGHVPMSDDPRGVADLIVETASATTG
jgi:pimeloyl-ACP methyl ester carboxylesterase